jgi:hypothetical protein
VFRNATVSVVMAAENNSTSTGFKFYNGGGRCTNSIENIQLCLRSDRTDWHFAEGATYIDDYFR